MHSLFDSVKLKKTKIILGFSWKELHFGCFWLPCDKSIAFEIKKPADNDEGMKKL